MPAMSARTGLPLGVIEPALIETRKAGLVIIADDHVRPSDTGRRYLNDLLGRFLPED